MEVHGLPEGEQAEAWTTNGSRDNLKVGLRTGSHMVMLGVFGERHRLFLHPRIQFGQLLLQGEGLREGGGGAAVVADVGGAEGAVGAVLEPFVQDLVAADAGFP